MFSNGKKSKIVNVMGRYLCMLLILGTVVRCIAACSKDDEYPEKDPLPKERPSDGLYNSEQVTLITSQDLLSKV